MEPGRDLMPTLVRRVRERGAPAEADAAGALAGLALAARAEPFRIWRLLDRWRSPAEALEALLRGTEAHLQGPRARLRGPEAPPRPDRRDRRRAAERRYRCIAYWDERYPAGLWRLPDPPPVLFAVGEPALAGRPALAVVGTRRCSEYGRRVAADVARAAGARGVVVVSGLAQGIDAAAHRAALDSGTIAVLGCGVDVAYPRANDRLRADIAARGLLVTEFPPGTPPLKHNFPRRNRLIAALSSALVVVEAPHRSGAQNTVTHALDIGLEVGAVPGPIDRPRCAGTNRLLRDGAAVIAGPADAVALVRGLSEGSGWRGAEADPGTIGMDDAARRPDVTGKESGAAALWSVLGPSPVPVDEIAERAGLSVAAASALLLELELAGAVRRWPGARYAAEEIRRGA